MRTIRANQLKINDVIVRDKYSFKVIKIESVTNKAITYRTTRLTPDFYEGNFFNRNLLNTILTIL